MNRKPGRRVDATRAGVSHAAARFALAIAVVRGLHRLTPELLAEIEAITQKLEIESDRQRPSHDPNQR